MTFADCLTQFSNHYKGAQESWQGNLAEVLSRYLMICVKLDTVYVSLKYLDQCFLPRLMCICSHCWRLSAVQPTLTIFCPRLQTLIMNITILEASLGIIRSLVEKQAYSMHPSPWFDITSHRCEAHHVLFRTFRLQVEFWSKHLMMIWLTT